MRLIELRLTNLNSLKGNWYIDFTDEAFVNEGIFAITGATGAGKTTILDAICLALYSQTPRLGKITGAANDIMTQGTGECAAEVVIEIDGKQFCCSWYQHRAYKKASGKLAAIRHQISEVASNKVLEDATSKTAPFIQALIGMDFDQFTRSIMLAQGSFAAFLKSDIANRAALLEKITGTAIYAQISKHVFEKFRDEKEYLARLESKIAHLPVLRLDDENAFKLQLNDLSKTQSQRRHQLQRLDEQLRRLEQLNTLTQQLSQYQNDLDLANQQLDDFASDNLRLMAANRALEIDRFYQPLSFTRQQLTQLTQEKSDLDGRSPLLFDANAAAEQALAQGIKEEESARYHFQINQPVLTQVRQLDGQIAQLSRSLLDDAARKSALNQQLSNLDAQISRQQHEVTLANEHLTKIETYLKSKPHHRDLMSDIASAQEYRQQLDGQLNAQTKNHAQQSKLETAACDAQIKLSALAKQRDDIYETAKRQKQQLDNLEQNRGKDNPEALQRQRYIWESSLEKLNGIQERLRLVHHHSDQINALIDQQALLSQDIQQSAASIGQLQDAIQADTATRRDKQAQWQLLQKVAKLEDYIADLEAGMPCPLCGATEHPYQNNHPQLALATDHSSTKALQEIMASLDDSISRQQQQLAKWQINNADMTARFGHQERSKSALFEQIQQLLTKCQSELTALLTALLQNGLPEVSPSQLPELFTRLLTEISEPQSDQQNQAPLNILQIEQVFDKLNALESAIHAKQAKTIADQAALSQKLAAIAEAKHAFDRQQQQLVNLNQDYQQAEHQLHLHQSHLEHIQKQTCYQNQQLIALLDKLISLMKKHPQSIPLNALETLKQKVGHNAALTPQDCQRVMSDCEQFYQQLLQLQSQFLAKQEDQAALSQRLTELSTTIKAQSFQRHQDQTTLSAINAAINDKAKQQREWQFTREQLFGSGNLDEKAAQLQQDLDAAKANLAAAERNRDAACQQLQTLLDQQQKINAAIIRVNTNLTKQEADFKDALIDAQFAHEAEFCQARLPKFERDSLNQQKLAIEQSKSYAKSQLDNTKSALDLARNQALSDQPITEIRVKKQALQADFDRTLSQMGGIEQKLLDNDQQKSAQSAQRIKIEQQKDHFRVWQQLYDLIGSADGKKYRTFAQSLTFEIMINHANQQLKKMSDRYLLIHDPDHALELSVIDNYQGGEVRSSKNLSGGEGFILSLALALGLSQMASQNIQVDSLFLDEGFGTLDDDSLDIALDTLTSLQQEGKLIGVISHVSALKSRILTQIQVKKRSGGVSILTGHGCQELAS